MNIFVLDYDPVTAAQFHCDKHVVKMPLETAQMLCTVYHLYGEEAPYKPCHQNHPCTQWASRSVENYRWLWRLGVALCKEYQHRYDKIHACAEVLALVRCAPISLTARGFTPFAQAMPDEYKCRETTLAYRAYYLGEKARIATWRRRNPPEFMCGGDKYEERYD